MSEAGALARLLKAARRRVLLQVLLEQGAAALIAGLIGLLLLLLAGTQILDWYWPLLLLAAVLAYGVSLMRRRIPSPYRVAQQVDQRLHLNDALSTAFYFEQASTSRPAPPELIEAQRRAAESTAMTIDAAAAAPIRVPRRLWAAAALASTAALVMAVRYGSQGTLDLRQPMVRLPFSLFVSDPSVYASAKKAPQYQLPEGVEALTIPSDGIEDGEGQRQGASTEEMLERQALNPQPAESKQGASAKEGAPLDEAGNEIAQADEEGEGAAAGDGRSQQESGSSLPGPKNAQSPSAGAKDKTTPQSSDQSSLMEKMREALANMLARLKMSPQAGEARKSMAAPQGAAQSAAAQKQAGKKGAPAPGRPQGEGQASSDQEGEQQGEGVSKNMMAQGQIADHAAEKQAAQEGKSGAGKQEGDKAIREAEQQAAMGKISEILGKRAQNLTGEILVEVSSGKQHLKTQLVQKNAAHADLGGEISRDEIPAAYRQFVQQYFEHVRKSAPVATGSGEP